MMRFGRPVKPSRVASASSSCANSRLTNCKRSELLNKRQLVCAISSIAAQYSIPHNPATCAKSPGSKSMRNDGGSTVGNRNSAYEPSTHESVELAPAQMPVQMIMSKNWYETSFAGKSHSALNPHEQPARNTAPEYAFAHVDGAARSGNFLYPIRSPRRSA